MAAQPDQRPSNEEPLYNIGAVSRMTGVAETTLRVWERRYGFPTSSRTGGGHRLYSQQEVSRLQWVKARVDDGMQISQAIKALHHMEGEGQSVRGFSSIPFPSAAQPVVPDEAFADFHQRLWTALMQHKADVFDQALAEALTVYSLEHVMLSIIAPILAELGTGWEDGHIDVATEHFGSNLIRGHLMNWLQIGPPAYNVDPVVLAGAPGELHEGSLLMLAILLRRQRWPVTYLGQTIALEDFAPFIEETHPSAIVFVAMTEDTAQNLSEWPRWLPEIYESNRPPVLIGGRIFAIQPDFVDRVPGIFLGPTLEDGIITVSKLLRDMHPHVR